MFCNRCGAKNSDEAIYCQKCAFRLEPEEETRISARPLKEASETPIFTVRPTLTFVKLGYFIAVLGAFLLVAVLASIDGWLKTNFSSWIFVLTGFLLLLIPAFYHLKRQAVSYTLTDSKIEIDEGFVSRKTRNVPLRTIQNVIVSSTIPQRILGFGDLIIENASESDGKIILKNIDSPKKYADILLKQMRQLN